MLNEMQLKAVNSVSKNILCLAGAGTGKTHTMIERIVKQVRDDNIDPQSILVLTFTNAAAREMKERYLSYKIDNRYTPNFRTFHALCYSLLQNDIQVRNLLGYVYCPDIISDDKHRNIETNAYITLGIKQPNPNKTLTLKEQADYELVLKYINKELRKNNYITFSILCNDVCKLFIDKHTAIQKYLDQYKYIYVDEFQDTDKLQYDFVCSFENAHKFYVGDALQNLYRFRGTDSSIIKELAVSDNVETIKMNKNYRSTKQICDFGNENSKYASDDYRIEINSDKDGIDVEVINTDTSYYDIVDENVIQYIIQRLEKLTGTTAILVRTNKEVTEIVDKLELNQLNVTTKGDIIGVTHYQRLNAMINDDYAIELIASYLNNDHYTKYRKENYLLGGGEDKMSWDRFLVLIYEWNEVKSLKEDILKLKDILRFSDNLNELLASNSPLIPKVDKHFDSLFQYIDYVKEIEEQENDSPQSINDNSIYCGTIHSVKGLEYDNVFLVNVDGRSFRLTNEDNNNLYYVGITRAKRELTVFKEM